MRGIANYKTWYEKQADESKTIFYGMPTLGEATGIIGCDLELDLKLGMSWTEICVIREQLWAIREGLATSPAKAGL